MADLGVDVGCDEGGGGRGVVPGPVLALARPFDRRQLPPPFDER